MECSYPVECFPNYQLLSNETIEPLAEYGSYENVNVLQKDGCFKFEFQKNRPDDKQLGLNAKGPTFPFLQPNARRLVDDSQSANSQELFVKYHHQLEQLKIFVKTKGRTKKKFNNFYKKLGSSSLNMDKLPSCLSKLVQIKQKLDAKMGTYKQITCSWSRCGCLSFLKHPKDGNTNFCFRATGAELSNVAVTPICPVKNCDDSLFMIKSSLNNQHILYINKPIYEINSTMCGSDGYFIARTKHKTVLFQLQSDDYFKCIDSYTQDRSLTSVAISPYLPGEFIYATIKGDIYSRDSELKTCNCIYSSADKFSLLENWWHCDYAAHPMHIIIACRTALIKRDLRGSSIQSDLFTLPDKRMYSEDLIFHSFPYTRNPFQHFIATTHQLVLLDERYSRNPLLHFNHFLSTPPLFSSVSLNVLENHQDVILLAGKESNEVMCFQLGLTSMNAPCSTSPPWCLGSLSKYFQKKVAEKTLEKRLEAPVIGLCSIPHGDNGFTGLYMSSFGDVFGQSYISSFCGTNKTFEESLNSNIVSSTPVIHSLCSEWLNYFNHSCIDDCELSSESSSDEEIKNPELLQKLKENSNLKKSHLFSIKNILDNLQASHEDVSTRNASCPFCNEENSLQRNNGDKYCSSCNMLIEESVALISAFKKGTVIDACESDLSLSLIDLNKKWDPISQSMLNYWSSDGQPPNANEALPATNISEMANVADQKLVVLSPLNPLKQPICREPEFPEPLFPECWNTKVSPKTSQASVIPSKTGKRTLASLKKKAVMGF